MTFDPDVRWTDPETSRRPFQGVVDSGLGCSARTGEASQGKTGGAVLSGCGSALEENEIKQLGRYRTRDLVLQSWA